MEMTKAVKPFIRRGWPNTFGNIVYIVINLTLSFFKFKSKTEVIWFGNSESQVLSDLGNLAPFCKSVVQNLGVQFDVSLKFEK